MLWAVLNCTPIAVLVSTLESPNLGLVQLVEICLLNISVKFGNSIINSKNVVLSDDVTANKIAKLHKGAYCAHHLHRNMACNGRKVDLG